MTDTKLRIAIIGGGLAGASLANALSQHNNLSIQLFESAPKFSERGAAVGLSSHGQTALKLAVSDYRGVIEKAGAVEMGATRVVMVSHYPRINAPSKDSPQSPGLWRIPRNRGNGH